MKIARYIGKGQVQIVDEPVPVCPPRGVLVQALACGLCSGELMEWYMDQKIPHVLGHEVSGVVIESNSDAYRVGRLIAPHHHAPCFECEFCQAGLYVHCPTWRSTKLVPGGMAEVFAVSEANLRDCASVDGVDPRLSALIEPIACVVKSIRRANAVGKKSAVIGMGVMGLLHAKLLGEGAVGFELVADRLEHARAIGIDARGPNEDERFEAVYVCPGSESALDFALKITAPGGVVVLFAPFPPATRPEVNLNQAYFNDISLVTSYSAGPDDFQAAAAWIGSGRLKPEEVISHFITLDELPTYYTLMKTGKILKPMVNFDGS